MVKRGRKPKYSDHARELIEKCHHKNVQDLVKEFDKMIDAECHIQSLSKFIEFLNKERRKSKFSPMEKREIDTAIKYCKKLKQKPITEINEEIWRIPQRLKEIEKQAEEFIGKSDDKSQEQLITLMKEHRRLMRKHQKINPSIYKDKNSGRQYSEIPESEKGTHRDWTESKTYWGKDKKRNPNDVTRETGYFDDDTGFYEASGVKQWMSNPKDFFKSGINDYKNSGNSIADSYEKWYVDAWYYHPSGNKKLKKIYDENNSTEEN